MVRLVPQRGRPPSVRAARGIPDAEAGGEHVDSEHFKHGHGRAASRLAKTPEIVNVEVPGTEWSLLGEMTVPARDGG